MTEAEAIHIQNVVFLVVFLGMVVVCVGIPALLYYAFKRFTKENEDVADYK